MNRVRVASLSVIAVPPRIGRALFVAFAVFSTAFFVARFWTVLAAGELFHRLGFDWSLFYAQAMALRAGVGGGIYDQDVIDRYLQPLMGFYGGPLSSLDGWPQPYPPWLAAVLVPLTLPSAPLAFALWLALSLAAAFFLAYRVKQFLPELGRVGAAAAILAAIPVAWGLFMGQPAVLLAVAVSEMFISFKAQRDFRAGLWLSALLLKPQYALLFGVFILWKRRWHAVAGAIVGGLGFVLLGLLAAGPQSFVRFASAIGAMSDLRNSVAGPNLMMNWRAIVLAVRPSIGEETGLVIVWSLSLLTMLVGLLLWRGKWEPSSPAFNTRFCALTLAALIGSYHSHPHGAALLIVPLAAAWATTTLQPITRVALWCAVYIPTFIVIWVTGVVEGLSVSPDSNVPLWTVWPSVLPAVLFVLAFGFVCIDAWNIAPGGTHGVQPWRLYRADRLRVPLSRLFGSGVGPSGREDFFTKVAAVRDAAQPIWLQAVVGMLLLGFLVERVWTVFRETGLFRRIGFDWGLFYGQSVALASGDVGAMYQVDRLGAYIQRLVVYTTTPDVPLLQWPAPYPPLLAAVLLPLTQAPPPIALGIWTALSVVAAGHLVWRANQLLPNAGAARLALLAAISLPVVQTLVQGQPVLFLASALAESFLALRHGADFRGGVWLGLLALKPQYGLLLGLFLLWKRRWQAVLGAAVGVALVVGISALVAGPASVLDYASGVSAIGDFRDPFAQPGEMVNWRALIVNLRPAIGHTSGVVLFAVLSLATVAVVAWATRGAWRARTDVLDLEIIAVSVATFLVGYHSHMHGLVLLAVPLAAAWRLARNDLPLELAVLGLIVVPTVVLAVVDGLLRGFAINYDDPLWIVWPVLNVALVVALLGATLRRLVKET